MQNQVTFVERRQRPRTGILAEIETITYRVLREHGIDGADTKRSSAVTAEHSA